MTAKIVLMGWLHLCLFYHLIAFFINHCALQRFVEAHCDVPLRHIIANIMHYQIRITHYGLRITVFICVNPLNPPNLRSIPKG
ncbi:MAG: hypothetical protein AAB116_23970, partial [Candidatus Poribacteria bacterium]